MRTQILIDMLFMLLPVVAFIFGLLWFGRRVRPMATYNVPRAVRRPETMTMSEEFDETCRRG